MTVKADEKEFTARVRIDTPKEQQYYRHGGILQFVLRGLLSSLTLAESRSSRNDDTAPAAVGRDMEQHARDPAR